VMGNPGQTVRSVFFGLADGLRDAACSQSMCSTVGASLGNPKRPSEIAARNLSGIWSKRSTSFNKTMCF